MPLPAAGVARYHGWAMIDMDLLRNVDLFAELEPMHLAHIASIVRREEHRRGDILFEDGDDGSCVYIVAKGKVRVSKMIPGVGEEALAVLPVGSYFGEMEFIERDLDRAARVTIHESAVLYAIDYRDLDDLFGSDRDLALAVQSNMLRTLARRLRATNDRVTAMFAMARFG